MKEHDKDDKDNKDLENGSEESDEELVGSFFSCDENELDDLHFEDAVDFTKKFARGLFQ